jgi:hypothetical protein
MRNLEEVKKNKKFGVMLPPLVLGRKKRFG